MEKSLFGFIWKYSRRNQLILLAVTLLTFPVLYISLELPKRIINDAIGGTGEPVTLLGVSFSQTQYLMLLCFGFLLAVLGSGLLKMRINTMKGILAERLLRRFRYQLLTRMARFPRPFFRTASQGELTAMITSEAEPMGGLMGDMLSQPVFQAGQMATILVFLFAQSFWFGLASVALIPLQAWLIPRLQRQINQLNKARIQETRKLAADIGETAQGVSDIRTNGGSRYRLALFSARLGTLFGIRFEIYQKKFFMKFLNNFINQLTPFFFYLVGGYLAIRGQITVGALVAALAAYKDLSAPWKELLDYYNQTQDMSLRWEIVTERFAPRTLVDDALFEGMPETLPRLDGDIELSNVTVRDEDGHVVLDDISLTIPKGAHVAVQAAHETAALAFADVLTREVIPQHGTVRIAGHALNELHQAVVANRIGYAHSKPHIFSGTLGNNLLLPFMHGPVLGPETPPEVLRWRDEAWRTGNSTDPLEIDWIDPAPAGFGSADEIHDWWFQLIEAIGIDDAIVRMALRGRLVPGTHPGLEAEIVRLRPVIAERLKERGLDDIVFRYHPDRYNPVSPLGSNLLYALPGAPLTQLSLAAEQNFLKVLRDAGMTAPLAEMSAGLIEGLVSTFGKDGTGHPLFRRLNIDEDLYLRLADIAARWREAGEAGVPGEDFALMLTVPFAFSSEQFGPAFTDALKARVLELRRSSAAQILDQLGGLFVPIDESRYFAVKSVLGNAIFGRISNFAGAQEKRVEDVVVEVLGENGLRRALAHTVYDVTTAPGGVNLTADLRERIAFSRAGIKKPDILILANALASHDRVERRAMRERIGAIMPDTTLIFIESRIETPESYDQFIEIVDGRIGGGETEDAEADETARKDLNRKLGIIAQTDLFGGLDTRQQRLLAFSASWYRARAGQVIFRTGDEPDAAYLCVKGLAALYWPAASGDPLKITDVIPGRLIGDLGVIQNQGRLLDMIATEDCLFLRIGATELLSVIEHDAQVATLLLRTVATHLTTTTEAMRAMRAHATARGVDFAEFDAARRPAERAET
ncbi:ABC transporter transmembrane domain-containing protein [Oceaniglobus roseus]|uniref:ABC transporter transmembrane domain-containing protein n=1 Tax=Oceaniglobus roseus TaxID=1737570 RepID=UPI000C7F29C2|nr:ABC transporter transmembrane domain-containing protein [Kandeliimicrobium roseum]